MIPIFRPPKITDEEFNSLKEVLNSGWIGLGPKTKEFEDSFSKYIEVSHSVAVNSCTAGLHIALLASGVKEGDEVITTPMSFASTSEAILYCGGTPIYADIQYGTLNIDPEDIRKKITNKTKAIVAVHYGGHPCDMEEINKIASEHNLVVIEDAAHACGSTYKSKKIGGLGNISCFSFHAVKNLPVGDGGMVTTNDPQIDDKLRKLRWMGINKDTYARTGKKYSWDYDIEEQGFKYHMNDISAILGIIQLGKLEKMNDVRREISSKYDAALESFKEYIDVPEIKPGIISSRHNYTIKLRGLEREELIEFLKSKGISAGVHYKPTYLHPRYSKFYKNDTPITDEVWQKLVLLPLFPDLTSEEFDKIISAIKEFIEINGK